MSTSPFSVRLPQDLDVAISEEAKRTRRKKGAVLAALADEALRCRRFPGIAFRGDDYNRRAWVIGTALDVWEVIWSLRNFKTPRKLAAALNISEDQLAIGQAYYVAHAGEIDEEIERHIVSRDALSSYPLIEVIDTR